MKKVLLAAFVLLNISVGGFSQIFHAEDIQFTRADTLRGSITPERAWWDLIYYHLEVKVNPKDSSFEGRNTILFKSISEGERLQIDLQEPMRIIRITQDGQELKYEQDGNAYFVTLHSIPAIKRTGQINVEFSGVPKKSKNPPWDGGVKWSSDSNEKLFMATANQGIGASLWWPCKDHMYDEVDSMLISVTVPKGLMDVSNGRLRKVEKLSNGWRTYHWFVGNPINNYGVNLNIANYSHFSWKFEGEKGDLDCDFYVLPENLSVAKKHFKEADRTLEAFEIWFGPYPFYEDGYKLVEVPYPGMEHQSSVTYGNGYKNGFYGRDLSQTGWGDQFDFIIVHESGHEWFANSITYKDVADMWIHEGFTAYSESLFVEYFYGKEAGAQYVIGTRSNVQNDVPIIGIYNLNHEGSTDMYPKSANMLHMIRQLVNDDEKWRGILRGLNETFYHQTVTTEQIESYMIEKTGKELDIIFDQYLRDVRIPVLEYRVIDDVLKARWSNCIPDFNMPVLVEIDGKSRWMQTGTDWEDVLENVEPDLTLKINPDFYVLSSNLTVKIK